MMRFRVLASLFLLLAIQNVSATTWDEPWHDAVIRQADIFVKVRISENTGAKATAQILKLLAGVEERKTIILQNYSGLNLASLSDRGELALPYKAGNEYYLLVKKDPKTNTYQTPTPTSGWAWIKDGDVYATYRHSYHQALVPVDIYEKTMSALFLSLKGKPVDDTFLLGFIRDSLSKPPAKLANDLQSEGTKLFFLQHVALESVSYLGKGTDLTSLLPFIGFSAPQVQISACRAVSGLKSGETGDVLMKFIEGKGVGFAKVMCVWGLKKNNSRDIVARLEAYLKRGTDEETGFGGSIMDPRVATSFPSSVKEAVGDLLKEWKQPEKKSP